MANPEPQQGNAIPPNRAAVEAAMMSPRRGQNRALGVFFLFLIGGLGIFILPKLGSDPGGAEKAPRKGTIAPAYGGAQVYPNSIRLLVDLPAKRKGGRRVELGGDLVFSYAADYDDFSAADAAIEANWDKAARLMMHMVAQHTRGEHLRNRVEIFREMSAALSTTLFPEGEGRVVQLEWKKLSLH